MAATVRESLCNLRPIEIPRPKFTGMQFVATRGRYGFYKSICKQDADKFGIQLKQSPRRPSIPSSWIGEESSERSTDSCTAAAEGHDARPSIEQLRGGNATKFVQETESNFLRSQQLSHHHSTPINNNHFRRHRVSSIFEEETNDDDDEPEIAPEPEPDYNQFHSNKRENEDAPKAADNSSLAFGNEEKCVGAGDSSLSTLKPKSHTTTSASSSQHKMAPPLPAPPPPPPGLFLLASSPKRSNGSSNNRRSSVDSSPTGSSPSPTSSSSTTRTFESASSGSFSALQNCWPKNEFTAVPQPHFLKLNIGGELANSLSRLQMFDAENPVAFCKLEKRL